MNFIKSRYIYFELFGALLRCKAKLKIKLKMQKQFSLCKSVSTPSRKKYLHAICTFNMRKKNGLCMYTNHLCLGAEKIEYEQKDR